LQHLLIRFSQLVVEQRWIQEIDINPLLASPEQLVALDARVLLHDPALPEEELPQLAIRPYPSQYVQPWQAKDGTALNIRPIRPEDEVMMTRFHEALSEHSVYMRYFRALNLNQRVAHERLTRICFIDYDREMALVATRRDEARGTREIVGVGRLSKVHGVPEAEFALLIQDDYHGHGLGTELLRRLLQVGRDEKDVERIVAYLLPENRAMKAVCQKLGFRFEREEDMIKAILDL
jgi:acetyltransferase